MNKENLSRYFWLNHEIERQEKRKNRLVKSINAGPATDIVKGSTSQFPYIETKFMISGVPTGILDDLEHVIAKNIQEAIELRCEIESFINNVDDPQLREILRSRYIDCQKWNQVGKDNYISASHARKTVRDFLENIS